MEGNNSKAGRADRWRERPLTTRQLEVARLIAADMSNKEIAALIGVKEQTVKNRVGEIAGRLGVITRVGIAIWMANNHQPPAGGKGTGEYGHAEDSGYVADGGFITGDARIIDFKSQRQQHQKRARHSKTG